MRLLKLLVTFIVTITVICQAEQNEGILVIEQSGYFYASASRKYIEQINEFSRKSSS